MQVLLGKHWHHLPVNEVVELLESNVPGGLDIFEVKHRQERFGHNVLTPKKGRHPVVRFLLQFHNPLLYILLVASAITFVVKDWVDAVAIFAVVLVNAIFGFIQESKAEKAIEALARTISTVATVIRTGRTQRISASDLVPGDLVTLQAGDRVPADLRLVESRDLQVSESALTGESLPVQKEASLIVTHDVGLADRKNMAYTSTLVTYGQAMGVVIAIGDTTEIGRISQLISTARELETPLTRKITRFGHILLYAILGLASVAFLVDTLYKKPLTDAFMAAITLAVSAIPEGLPAAVTIILAIGVSRMARRRAIIRKLPAVETLGSTTIICSDKTGTLTQNQMAVQQIIAGEARYETTGTGYVPSGHILRVPTTTGQGAPINPSAEAALMECLKTGLLCNDSFLVEKEGRWDVHGDPTEGALIVSAYKGGLSLDKLRELLPRVDTIPFDSQHQYMATLHVFEGKRKIVYVKGAVEVLLGKCTTSLTGSGQLVPLVKDTVQKSVDEMASGGLRVLAFARKDLPQETARVNHADIATGLTFLGLQGMIDPPRQEAVAAVRACQHAGMRVKMITGDHALTAAAIAQQIGLYGSNSTGQTAPAVLTGKEIGNYNDEELIDVAERTAVFARVSPEQKLRLVEALQSRGHRVAMTGDGVNDAPALKQADIGVAMGASGTEVAKEAADMILTDDNFATIEAAVEEGRGVFDNLTKFILWSLPVNLGQSLILLAAIFTGVTLPILPVQVLWINMTTSGIIGMTLAFEPKEPDIMSRPPRDPESPLLSPALIWQIALVGILTLVGAFGLFEWEQFYDGASIEQARTVSVNVVAMVQLLYLFNCRSIKYSMFRIGVFSNPWIIFGIIGMVGLQLVFTYVPVMNRLFSTAPISLYVWGRIMAVSVVTYLIVMFMKWLVWHVVPSVRKAKYATGPEWLLNATVIEACSCPVFCIHYYTTKPINSYEGRGTEACICLFNHAFRVNKGRYGNIKLHGSKFWVAGSTDGNSSKGKINWSGITFDPSVTKEQRTALISVMHHLYEVERDSFTITKDARIEWHAGKGSAEALLDGGKIAEMVLRLTPKMSDAPVMVQNLKFWGSQSNNGFALIPSKVSAYRAGDRQFEFRDTNGFVTTIEITSKAQLP